MYDMLCLNFQMCVTSFEAWARYTPRLFHQKVEKTVTSEEEQQQEKIENSVDDIQKIEEEKEHDTKTEA